MFDKEQIIKALENCNADGDCSVCPYERARFPDELECTEELHADAISLIRELTIELDAMRGTANALKMHLENAEAETERLKAENAEQDEAIIKALQRMGEVRRETQTDTVSRMQQMFENSFDQLQEFFSEDTYENLVASNAVLELLDKIAKEILEETK